MKTVNLVQKVSSDGEFCLDGSGELKIKTNKYGNLTLGSINYSSSCMSDGSLETDLLLQKMVSDGEFSLDDFRKLCLDNSEVEK